MTTAILFAVAASASARAEGAPGTGTVTPLGCSEVLLDGTFEAGDPWPAWTVQTSTNSGTPICDPGVCGGPPPGPHAGTNWVWFGGWPDAETATIGQTFTVPAFTTVRLTGQIWIATSGGLSSDTLRVTVDGVTITSWTAAESSSGYSPFSFTLPIELDAGSHDLLFRYDAEAHVPGEGSSFHADSLSLTACVQDSIFRNGFDSGTLSAWSAAVTDSGDLGVSAAAALKSTAAGLHGIVDDTAGLYVQDNSPGDEGRYRARFYFDTSSFDPGETENHRRTRLFIAFEENPNRRLAAIVLRRLGGQYSLLGRARLDDDSQYDTGFFPIDDGVHFVELAWTRSSGPDAGDGSFELWIDGSSVHAATTLDNSAGAVDFVRLGALSVKTGATGTLYWDEFESRRVTYIGP
jgi:hypothetical protein